MKTNTVPFLIMMLVALLSSFSYADTGSNSTPQTQTSSADTAQNFLGAPQSQSATPPPSNAVVMTAQPVLSQNQATAIPQTYSPPPPPPVQQYMPPPPSRKQKHGPFQHVTNFFKSLAGVD